MRWVVLATLAAGGCTAEVTQQPDAALPADAAPDTMQLARACPPGDTTLAICLSFDGPTLANPYANEGTLAVSANLTNVQHDGVDSSGVALVTATSEMQIPTNPVIAGIVAVDMRIRLDADVPAAGRIGLLDVDNGAPGMSLFIYAGTAGHRIRCNLGAVDLYADTVIAIGTFTDIACACKDGNVSVRRDGVTLAELAGTPTCQPANAASSPLQIGQNSRADDSLPPNEPLIGAIDRVRLWTAVP